MNGFIKQTFALAMLLFRCNALDVNSLKCFSINNTQSKVRPEIININCNEPSFYPYSVKINKSSGSYNNANDAYPKVCLPDVVENLIVRVFNLMSRTNETRYI